MIRLEWSDRFEKSLKKCIELKRIGTVAALLSPTESPKRGDQAMVLPKGLDRESL